jgi:hypothetical protein
LGFQAQIFEKTKQDIQFERIKLEICTRDEKKNKKLIKPRKLGKK